MRIIEPSTEIIEQNSGLEGLYKHIELCGRTCYKSEDKITEDSAKKFVDTIIKSGHGSVLEHGTVYLAIPMTTYAPDAVNIYRDNAYSKVNDCNEFIFTDKYGNKVSAWCVTTNLRVLVENDCLEDLEFLCEPTEYHEKRAAVKFICSRGISHELVRHRIFSFSQESQRYCAYNKDKFGGEITFIKPIWYEQKEDIDTSNYTDYGYSLLYAENRYLDLLEQGLKAQEAREVLPNSTKTEVIMTGFTSDWLHFFKLRTDKAAHPEMRKLTIPLEKEFKKKGLL